MSEGSCGSVCVYCSLHRLLQPHICGKPDDTCGRWRTRALQMGVLLKCWQLWMRHERVGCAFLVLRSWLAHGVPCLVLLPQGMQGYGAQGAQAQLQQLLQQAAHTQRMPGMVSWPLTQ